MTSTIGERMGPFPSLREQARLWVVVMGPPLAWSAGLALDYALVRVACPGRMVLLHLVTVATLSGAVIAGIVAVRRWRRAEGAPDRIEPPEWARDRFMLALAIMTSAFFSFAILSQWLPKLFLHPCVGV